MKISFITIHVGHNFGSVLQTIATERIFKDAGLEPICINYIPPRVTDRVYWKEGLQSGTRIIRRILYYPARLITRHKYSSYLAKHCNLSKPIYNNDDFVRKCPVADLYVTGSDQVWNFYHNEGIDNHYFFEGITGKKVAFASSIGMTELPQEYEQYMQRMLKNFSYISVREASAVKLFEKWGIQSTQLIDPTLMLDKKSWEGYASKRLCKEPYIFVYLPYNTEDKDMVYRTVRRISEHKHLKVVTYSYDFFKKGDADKTIRFADPGDVLSLFLYAEYVVTNSFHGTAFSINLNKNFFVYMPTKFSTRLISLLELCKLEGRILDSCIGDETINELLDFSYANKLLKDEREKAMLFIRKVIQ